ncbi:MAG: hypothetical protein ABI900_06295 [Betaproteobacteria bacterium]
MAIDIPGLHRHFHRPRAAALALMIAATLAAPALAAPRVLVYATDDTPQLRATFAGVREALGMTAIGWLRRLLPGARYVGVLYDPAQNAEALLLFSFRHTLPLVGLSQAWVQAGALYAVDWNYRELGVFCGRLALRQLLGSHTTALNPPRSYIFVNLRSAQLLHRQWDASMRQSFDWVAD